MGSDVAAIVDHGFDGFGVLVKMFASLVIAFNNGFNCKNSGQNCSSNVITAIPYCDTSYYSAHSTRCSYDDY